MGVKRFWTEAFIGEVEIINDGVGVGVGVVGVVERRQKVLPYLMGSVVRKAVDNRVEKTMKTMIILLFIGARSVMFSNHSK